jgi:hypothetical protein
MAERSVLASPSDNETDLPITTLAAARKGTVNDETVTVAECDDWDGIGRNYGFGTGGTQSNGFILVARLDRDRAHGVHPLLSTCIISRI